MTDKLGMALSKVLFQYEPTLLAADLDATARAAAEVSNLLGCIMATVLAKNPAGYEAAFKAVILKANDSAQATARKAFNMTSNCWPMSHSVNFDPVKGLGASDNVG
jgi:hypothetical protein